MFQPFVEQKLHAEAIEGAAEEDRCGCVRQHRGVIPFAPGVFEHFEFFHCPVEGWQCCSELCPFGWQELHVELVRDDSFLNNGRNNHMVPA